MIIRNVWFLSPNFLGSQGLTLVKLHVDTEGSPNCFEASESTTVKGILLLFWTGLLRVSHFDICRALYIS
jgi:hypothetical protein